MNPRYPIMAALLAASLGVLSQGTSHATPPPCTPNPNETNAVNIIAARAACEPQIRIDIGERVARFVLQSDAQGPLFVSRQIFTNQNNPTASATIAGYARAWTSTAAASAVSVLYSVMGDNEPPAWVAGNSTLRQAISGANRTNLRVRLVTALLPGWRHANGTEGRIAWTGSEQNTSLFLSSAAAAAYGILNDPRVRAEIEASIASNEDRPIVPVGPGSGNRTMAQASQFTYEDMYARGGALATISGPGDTNSAQFYMKLESQRDPASGAMQTFVAIYDNSVDPCYIRRVPMTASGPQTIQHASGRWRLVVEIQGTEGGEQSITLRRPRDEGGTSGFTINASDLARARLAQAIDKGQMLSVGGQSYYVLAQGGGRNGSHVFFPAELATRRDGSWMDLRPELVAVTSRVGPDGDFLPAPGKVGLGAVRGQEYHLFYNAETRRWEVREGAGDPPAGAAPAPGASTATAPGATGPGALDPRVAAAAATAGFNPMADNFSAEARTRGYSLRTAIGQNGTTGYYVMTPPASGGVENNHVSFAGVTGFRGFGHYITFEMGGRAYYMDIYLPTTTPDSDRRPFFETVAMFEANALASINRPNTTEKLWLKDHDVLTDALTSRLRYSEADRTAVLANMRQAVTGTEEYVIGSAIAGRIFINLKSAPAQSVRVWPGPVERTPRTDGDNPQTEGGAAGQQSTVIAAPSAVDEGPFLASVRLPGEHPATVYDTDTGNIATANAVVYEKTTANPNEKEWYLSVKVRERNPDNSLQVRRISYLKVFSRVAAANLDPAPSVNALNLRGYQAHGEGIRVGSASITRLTQSTEARGVWCLKAAPASQATALTRVGPVMWWGVEAAAAEAACRDERL